jgi:cysteine synthase
MACSLAFFGRVLGYKVKVVCNKKLTEDKRQFIRYFGAELEYHGEFTIDSNRRCEELARADGDASGFCFVDQLRNPASPRAYFETLGPELLRDLPNLSAVVGSIGSGASMLGVARFLRRESPETTIVTTQAASGTVLPGTGQFVDGRDFVTPFIDELEPLADGTVMISQSEAERRTAQLAEQGIFVGYQGGGVLQALIESINERSIRGDTVAIIGDAGWKNMEKLEALASDRA